ncbi:stage V sporulation protein AD [Ruminococcus sp. YE71]|uniref:stage V sporulation protein AD n=1 Tax=unclassified Ruminococcus TaxID=2608920 RepID=UPI000890DE16|nr:MULTISPECIES: stage V sporulation protein AD [unclassified Ruminococcus]SDA27423.1 stage V sporulation protein AD [Ruminococcus sp. YE78]SFW45090.1 stage V sporulation protein AD [Ruminococcus sp. YE71]
MKQTHIFSQPPSIISSAAVGGKMESAGPLADCFDKINDDPYLSTDTFEKGESKLQKEAMLHMMDKAGLSPADFGAVFGGDLLNQCTGTTYAMRDLGIPFLGIYGACSTMAEGLIMASVFVSAGAVQRAAAVTSSHFCSAERQYRFPLNYGGQRTPTSQWTATAGGALCVSAEDRPPYVRGYAVGVIEDLGVTDAANMGAAMAPAAWSTVSAFLRETGRQPQDFDMILTGDLGKVGSRLFCELAEREGVNVRGNHADCGTMLYSFEEQDVHAGGSGCGCCASVLCGLILPRIACGGLKNVLFAATGALMSPTVNQQGESIPSISHAVWLSAEKEEKA